MSSSRRARAPMVLVLAGGLATAGWAQETPAARSAPRTPGSTASSSVVGAARRAGIVAVPVGGRVGASARVAGRSTRAAARVMSRGTSAARVATRGTGAGRALAGTRVSGTGAGRVSAATRRNTLRNFRRLLKAFGATATSRGAAAGKAAGIPGGAAGKPGIPSASGATSGMAGAVGRPGGRPGGAAPSAGAAGGVAGSARRAGGVAGGAAARPAGAAGSLDAELRDLERRIRDLRRKVQDRQRGRGPKGSDPPRTRPSPTHDAARRPLEGAGKGTGGAAGKPAPGTSPKLERFLQKNLKLDGPQAARTATALRTSPVLAEMRMPFTPSNLLFGIGATAGIHLFSQVGDEDGSVGQGLAFLTDSSFWGGLIGSGVGYSVASVVAMSLIPGGAGLLPMVAPVFAGMTGSILGWELGAGMFGEEGLRGALAKMSPSRVLGQAAGTTAGLLLGANAGAALGGTLGSIAGPLGAVVGAVVMGELGTRLGDGLRAALAGDSAPLDSSLGEVGATLKKMQGVEDALDLLGDHLSEDLPMASMVDGGLAARIKDEYRTTYGELRDALVAEDRAKAFLKLQYLQNLAKRYEALVGESLRGL